MKAFLFMMALSAALLAACAEIRPLFSAFTPEASPPAVATATLVAAAIRTSTNAPTAEGPTTLRVWVPPRFDPNSGEPAGELLKARLNEFTRLHPDIQLEVRVKALSGAGGLLDALVTTSTAAPQAMPDVVALSRETLEAAALKGLLHTFRGFTDIQDGADWYEYARQLAQLQNSVYGLPFAGDVGLLAYRPGALPVPPADWSAVLELQTPLVFAAGDPNSIFTLALYQARGGAIQDSQGHPYLDTARLEEVLSFYADAQKLGVMPDWLTQLQDDQEAWDTLLGGGANLVFTWSSRFLSEPRSDLTIAPLPTPDAVPFTLANGWVWALSSPDENRLQLGMELALFLVEDQFMSSWTQASGYLPPRPSALGAWKGVPLQLMLDSISRSARLQPPEDIMTSLGAPLQQATLAVLKGESEPADAARAAVDALQTP